MLRLLSKVYQMPVVPQNLGEPIDMIKTAIIDPDKGKIMAYRLRRHNAVLSTVDILHYYEDGILVSDQDALQAITDLPRLRGLIERPIELIGLRVVTEKGRKLGKISDVLMESDGHFIAKLYVQPTLISRLITDELIIPREKVVRMTSKEAVVRYEANAQPAGAAPETVP